MNKRVSKNNDNNCNDMISSFVKHCRKEHTKVTPQRVAIYEELLCTQSHPTAQDLFNKLRNEFPSISLDTVNRNLLDFYHKGIIDMVEGSGDAKRFDANRGEHNHFRCVRCRKITDLHEPELRRITIPQTIREKFKIISARIHFEGICSDCLNASSA